jgi:hypothetical protein
MSALATTNSVINPGWLRALLFYCLYALLTVFIGTITVFVIGTIADKPATEIPVLATQAPWLYFTILIMAILSLALVMLFRKSIDRQSFASLGLSFNNNGANAALGFFTGTFILGLGTLLLYHNNNLSWVDVRVNATTIFIEVVTMAIIAFYEEIVFRGYILQNLLFSVNKWLALVISAVFFSVLHITNPNFTIFSLLNIFLAGLLLGINYIYTRNLWYGILLHFSWNFLQGPVLGYKVSGTTIQSILEQQLEGSAIFTGGVFGFEGSLVCTILTAILFLLFALVYHQKYRVRTTEN